MARMLFQEEVEHIALLARIGLKPEENADYQEILSSVLDWFRALEEVETERAKVATPIHTFEEVARADRIEDWGATGKAAIKRNFPDVKDGFVKVRAVF